MEQPWNVLKPVGETYKITVTNTISSLPTIPDGAKRCLIQVESQDIRIKFNATNSITYCATSGVGGGLVLPVNTVANPFYVIDGRDAMNNLRAYRSGSTDSFINVIFMGDVQPTSYLGGTA